MTGSRAPGSFSSAYIVVFTCLFAWFCLASDAIAAAWTQEKGHGQAIQSVYAYSTSRFYTPEGDKQSQPRFHKLEYNLYGEYGVTPAVTAGASVNLQRLSQNTAENSGIGDSEFFARFKAYDQAGLVLSVQPLIKLPSPATSADTPEIGSDAADAELRALCGYGFSAGGMDHFAALEFAYRSRFGAPHDQLRLDAKLGIRPAPRWMGVLEFYGTRHLGDNSTSIGRISAAEDYDLGKVQLSAVYELTPKVSLQLGGFTHAYARNTGGDGGVMFSLWYRF